MNVLSDGTADEDIEPFSLFMSLLRDPKFAPDQIDISYAPVAFLERTGLVRQKRMVVDTPSDVEFAHKLLPAPEVALGWISFFPNGAGMVYVKAMALLESERWEEATVAFDKAASGLCSSPRTARVEFGR
jgi:hypothetical protein